MITRQVILVNHLNSPFKSKTKIKQIALAKITLYTEGKKVEVPQTVVQNISIYRDQMQLA